MQHNIAPNWLDKNQEEKPTGLEIIFYKCECTNEPLISHKIIYVNVVIPKTLPNSIMTASSKWSNKVILMKDAMISKI